MSKTTTILKRLGIVTLWAAVLTGFVILMVAANNARSETVCKKVNVKLEGKDDNFFIEAKDIKSLINKDKSINPVGKPVGSIDVAQLEKIISSDPWVKNAELYFDNKQQLNIKITQREPVARVFTFSGNSFYLDESGERIPVSTKYAAKVPVFTGFPTDAEKLQQPDSLLNVQIVQMGSYIISHPFWMAQVAQLMITPERRFEFIPQLGDQVIAFGDGNDIDKKFTKLLAFYQEGLNKVGWNNYSRINIAFEDQVVCTRKDGVPPLQPVVTTDSVKVNGADEVPEYEDLDSTSHATKKPEPVTAAKPATKPTPDAKAKAAKQREPEKEKAKTKEKARTEKPKPQPKAVYKPGNKSVNTSKKQNTP
ncbi:cell division protein FtsQ [Chitinophaga dinghuensis]|uniref:Cell division protein FtsQ n=1 Tax=Chitinophaga dinghuensis TaxID=1539050 RepID=A0A327VM63_9BACT|nr:cell division protein FtsQ [Chitinophaga dinghuensis]